ncbi:pilus assembly protein [Cellulomonas sp. JH27-2]|uniref:pilus assembly protein TadG-related protein n=1 Tax=Cellulomonas sp. JH27-2 TaxID=2774139 RepID=UPI0017818198|nr:pilus assembly protein TadG-related protein [Cellulomonas sp. JH27-2]MBD8058725.1 pilus assembly protein [Cellulomonas sp. JH27-2]
MRRLAVIREQNDRGTISVFVIGLAVALLILAGLVVDGGRAINARAAANDDAEQAARAGANQIDDAVLRSSGRVVINQDAARTAARRFLTVKGYPAGDIQVSFPAEGVRVQVGGDVDTTLLSLISINTFHVTGSATARAAVGIVNEIGGAP